MADELRARLADALVKHASGDDGCICGGDDHLAFSYWARHVADVLLSLPRIAIVELPENPHRLTWPRTWTPHELTVNEMREFAAALLAVAQLSEKAERPSATS